MKITLCTRTLLAIILLSTTVLISNTSQALTKSQPALSDEFMPMVQINPYVRDGNGGMMQGLCNATFIHPQAMVTAAHCLAEAYQTKKFKLTTKIGKYKYVTRPDGTVFRAGYANIKTIEPMAQFLFTPGLKSKLDSTSSQVNIAPEEDLAVILLPEPVEMPDPIPFIKTASQQEIGGLYNSLTSYQPTVVSVNFVAEITSSDTKRMATLNNLQAATGSWNSNSTSRVEEGDSGSGLLARIGKEWKLVGVVKGHANSMFSEWDVFAAADGKICKIAQSITNAEIKTALCH